MHTKIKIKVHTKKKANWYDKHINQVRKELTFKLGDYVSLHLRKEIFSFQRKFKLQLGMIYFSKS